MEFVHLLLYLGVLFTFISTNNSNSDVSKTRSLSSASSPFHHEENKEFEDDEVQRRSGKSALGWSTWSDFSTCSRTCDGGVAFQLRRCHSPQGCKGESVRYKICNMQACPDKQDFRAQQCAAYNDVPYDGALFDWVPHYDYAEPCALTCRGRPDHLRDEKLSEAASDEESEEASVIVQLSNRVQDGTRCRPGSLDMCIQGKCQRVGCDLKIGSTKKIDSCGVCGGDGSTCSQPLYHWEIAPMSLCSVTCGGGYKMSLSVCRNRLTSTDVEDSLCNHASRPVPTVVQCNTHACPPKWITDEWGPCNRTCGGGVRERLVVCAEESNGARHRVPDEACRNMRPKVQESCNTHDCPKWVTSEWSGCSSSCGSGMQVRSVECIDQNGIHNTQCEPSTRPNSMQNCYVGIPCIDDTRAVIQDSTTEFFEENLSSEKSKTNVDDDSKDNIDKNFDDLTDEDTSDDVDGERDINETNQQKTQKTMGIDDETEEDDEEMQGDEPMQRNYNNNPYGMQYRMPRAEHLLDSNTPNEPTFIPGEWGPCSVTCGEGVRRRQYECKIFLEFSKVIAKIDDSKCHSTKPADDYERCFMEPCSYAYGSGIYDDTYRSSQRDRLNGDQIKVQAAVPGKTYSWRDEGYTACSASCLGGVEELIINCVRDDTGKVVSPYLCSPETKPENRIRTCNDIPCPPRWNYSDFSPCTKSCGIGIKTREISCIHEVTRGGENTMIVPNSMCPQPPPSDRQYCNVLDCPARWEVGDWSRCSKSCGGGFKERSVVCKQTMAQDHKVGRVDSMCPGLKPADKKPCNTKACPPEDDRPIISANDGGKYIQHDPGQKKISLKVGGAAQVFYGVQVKIKCPVKKYNRTKIKWSKDHNYLPKSRKYKVSKKGALRILDVTFKDGGVYTCHAGLSGADIQLTIKPRPGEFPSSEESERNRDPSGRFKYSDSPVHGLKTNSSYGHRTRQRNRTRKQHVNDNPANSNGQPKEEEEPLQSHSQMTHTDSSSLTPSTSSGNRNLPLLPHFEHLLASLQFLWPLQAFRNSKAHQAIHDQHLKYAIDPGERALEQDDDPRALPQIASPKAVEKSLTDDLEFEFYVGPWSACSQTCGINDSGYRLRSVHCMVKVKNVSKTVDNILCEDAGLISPDTVEKCGNVPCPQWITTEWTPCRSSKCFAWHTALQKRNVSCTFDNETVSDKCDENEKPTTKRECYNELCKGVWRVEQWSECNAPCNGKGTRYRTISCVWYGTKRPAGNACNNHPRPAVMKPCSGQPCVIDPNECKDISKYCNNVKTMGLCRLHRFQQTCCSTCKFNIYDKK